MASRTISRLKQSLPGDLRLLARKAAMIGTRPLRRSGILVSATLDEQGLRQLENTFDGVEVSRIQVREQMTDPTLDTSPIQRAPRPVAVDRSLVRVRTTEGWRFDLGHLITPDHQIVYESNLSLIDLPAAFGRLTEAPRRVDGTVAYLSNTWPTNFYHWLVLTLPLISRYRELGEPDWYYVGTQLQPWQEESLGLLGIDLGRVIHEPVTADELWASVSTRIGGGLDNESATFLRDAVGPVSTSSARRRLFVSRGVSTTRRFLNEADAFDVAQAFGFEWVVTSDMSLADEIRLFSSAEAIVGCHGAALTNVCFAPANALLIELFPFGLTDPSVHIFQELASAIGGRYAALEGTVLSGPTRKPVDCDLLIDVDDLGRLLRQLLAATPPALR